MTTGLWVFLGACVSVLVGAFFLFIKSSRDYEKEVRETFDWIRQGRGEERSD